MSKPTGPNQQDEAGQRGGQKDQGDKQHQQQHGENPAQHHGGVGNLQDEPPTADDAKRRAAEKAHKSQ